MGTLTDSVMTYLLPLLTLVVLAKVWLTLFEAYMTERRALYSRPTTPNDRRNQRTFDPGRRHF